MSTRVTEGQKQWDAFLERWPVPRLRDLTLEEYYGPQGSDTLFGWLRDRTGLLGDFQEGPASAGVRPRGRSAQGEPASGLKADDRYIWYSILGNSAEQAFANLKQEMLIAVEAVQRGDLDGLKQLSNAPGALVWKMAFLYQDQSRPLLLPFNTLVQLKRVATGAASNDKIDLQRQLMAQRGGKALLAYAEELERQVADHQGGVADRAGRQIALNQILFGPPGTGKTYATIDAALEILDPEFFEASRGDRSVLKERFDELVVDGRAKFVTFHQSFSYEDFVEGVGALVADEQLGYEVRSGVFKKFCDQAASLVTEADDFDDAIESLRELARAEVVLDVSESKFRLRALEEDFLAIQDDGLVEQVLRVGDLRRLHRKEVVATNIPRDRSGHSELKALLRFFSENLKSTLSVRMAGGSWLIESCPLDSNILVRYEKNSGKVYVDRAALRRWLSLNGYEPRSFQGALREHGVLISDSTKIVLGKGVGIQSAQRICWVFRFGDESFYSRAFGVDASELNQLSYTGLLQAVLLFMQENFGLQPVEGDSECRPLSPYVLIIDEINRGNVSRIFGELITLIEESKRAGADEELSVVLPYSKECFSVPGNVYLIGTMNTADRSLAGLDIALRRRFTFREMPPRPELLDGVVVGGIDIGQLLRTMNERIEVLLDRDHCLGHAYFMPLMQDNSLERLEAIFRNQVLPLLQEYFFEDWQRIQWVLNDHRKAALDRFVYQSERDLRALFGGEAEVSAHNLPWRINEAAFGRASAYAGTIAVQAKVAAPLGVPETAEA